MITTYIKSAVLAMALMVAYYCHGQNPAFALNKQFPDLVIPNVINHTASSLNLSQFKGKAVIINFWHTGCFGCIKRFPKWEALQKAYNDQIQIILVNPNSRDSTERFFAIRKRLNLPTVPFITGDTLLMDAFYPEERFKTIWIDKMGIVRAVTQDGDINSNNINDFLANKKVNFTPIVTREFPESLFDEKWQDNLQYYSYISEQIDRLNILSKRSPDVTVISSGAADKVMDLYSIAFQEEGKHFYPAPFRFDAQVDAELLNKRYIYDLMLPKAKDSVKYEIMRQDLERYFNLQAYTEVRTIKGLSLVKTSQYDKLTTKGGKVSGSLSRAITNNDSFIYIQNIPFFGFTNVLRTYVEDSLRIPMNDASGYNGRVDMRFDAEFFKNSTLAELRSELKRYDLDLVESEFKIEVLVLKNK